MANDLDQRVDEIIASMRGQPRPPSDLYITVAQSRAALRRVDGARAEFDPSDRAAAETMIDRAGDFTQAVLSLYLAASAAQRWCKENGNAGPIGQKRLGDLVATLTDLRNAIMHWDMKRRTADVFLAFGERDILALLPQGRSQPTVIAGITWSLFEKYATRLERWASAQLGIESAT